MVTTTENVPVVTLLRLYLLDPGTEPDPEDTTPGTPTVGLDIVVVQGEDGSERSSGFFGCLCRDAV